MLIPHAVMVDGDLQQPALAQFEYQVFYHPPGPARLEMRMKGKRMADGVGHTTPAFVPPTSADAQESKGQRGPYICILLHKCVWSRSVQYGDGLLFRRWCAPWASIQSESKGLRASSACLLPEIPEVQVEFSNPAILPRRFTLYLLPLSLDSGLCF